MRVTKKSVKLYEKAMRRDEEDPLYKTATRVVAKRLKTQTGWRDRGEEESIKGKYSNTPRERRSLGIGTPPWKPQKKAKISCSTMGVTTKEDSPENRRKEAMAHLNSLQSTDTVVFTDGSAKGGTKDGGSGVHIIWKDKSTKSAAFPAGKWCSSCRTELVAIQESIKILRLAPAETRGESIRILTDSKAALEKLANADDTNKSMLVSEILKGIEDLETKGIRVELQWIPSHCDIEGNETADTWAKTGSDLAQDAVPLELDTVVNAAALNTKKAQSPIHSDWYASTFQGEPKYEARSLPRKDSITLHQLRTGKSSLLKSYRHKIGKEADPYCNECKEDGKTEDAHHLLIDCPR